VLALSANDHANGVRPEPLGAQPGGKPLHPEDAAAALLQPVLTSRPLF
jgi:hypothetical protein